MTDGPGKSGVTDRPGESVFCHATSVAVCKYDLQFGRVRNSGSPVARGYQNFARATEVGASGSPVVYPKVRDFFTHRPPAEYIIYIYVNFA